MWSMENAAMSITAPLRITLRFALVVIIAVRRCCYTMIEQPRSSLMKLLPCFETIAAGLSPHMKWSFVNLSDSQILVFEYKIYECMHIMKQH